MLIRLPNACSCLLVMFLTYYYFFGASSRRLHSQAMTIITKCAIMNPNSLCQVWVTRMASYKVIQDIEAEDKLVGPLSLRQFIYAGIAAVALYICFLAYSRGVPFLIVFFLPVAAIAGFFGFPWKGEQPTEIWALARIRFAVKPRVRIWNQDGVKDLVTVMAPKVMPKQPVRNLSQTEVQSRLKALADTIDSRGWATRNANYQYYANQRQPQSDRLVNASDIKPEAIPLDAFLPSNDILDDQNPVAKNLDTLLAKSNQQARQRVMQEMAQASQPPPAPAATNVQGGQPATTPAVANQAAGGLAGVSGLQFQEVSSAGYSPAPSLPRPITPMTFSPSANGQVPQGQPTANPYWFAGPQGAAAPVNPAVPQPLVQPQTIQAVPAAAPPQAITPNMAAQPGPAPAPGVLPTGLAPVQAGEPTPQEQAMAQQLRANNQSTMDINYNHMRVMPAPASASLANALEPAGLQPPAPGVPTNAAPVTHQPDPAILELAKNDDLNVATLARQAEREVNKTTEGGHDVSAMSNGTSNGVEIPLR